MAGGKLTPRQKMINMMYLVLMAMLALNVSKEVLLAFGHINDSIVTTTAQLTTSSKFIMADLASKNENNPKKYGELYKDAKEVEQGATKLITFLDDLTLEFESKVGERDENGRLPWGEMDSSIGDEVLFPGGNPEAGKGAELDATISGFRELLLSMDISEDVKTQVENSLDTSPTKTEDGLTIRWVKHKFEHYPLAAVITFISQIKADVRNAESTVLTSMIKEGFGEQITVNKMEALPLAISSTVMKGAKFEAKVMLAAYDSTLVPEIFLWKVDENGKRLDKSEKKLDLESGAGIVEIPTSRTGEFFWGGVVRVKSDDGAISEYKFNSKYNVNEPAVVISADKMNVLYRGVQNPISISVPGVPANKISATGPGLRKKGNGKWIANVTTYKGREGKVVVTAIMADGTKKTFPGQNYRIKDIPMPLGVIAGKSELKIPSGNLAKMKIEAIIPNFEFDLKLTVVSFSLKIQGKPTYNVTGNRMDGRVQKALKRVSAGQEVIIRNIKVKLPNNSKYRVAKVAPILVTIR